MTDGLEQAADETVLGQEPQENELMEPEVTQDQPVSESEAAPVSAAEEKARSFGWRPKEEWGGNDEDWRDPNGFLIYKDFADKHKAQQAKIDSMEQDFNSRTESLNKLHQITLEGQRAQLSRDRDEAIDLADRDEVNRVQGQIDKLNNQEPVINPANSSQQPQEDPAISRWNNSNPWIMGSDPKAAYAKQQFLNYQSQNYTAAQAIQAMEQDVNRAFPAINPNRENHPAPEGGTRPGQKPRRSLVWSGLRPEELKYFQRSPEMWGNNKERFLKDVMESRNEESK